MNERDLVGRDAIVRQCLAMLRGGASVSVVGRRLSGRTSLLNAVRDRLLDEGWNAVTVGGLAALQPYPLSHLQTVLELDDTTAGQRGLSVGVVAARLRESLVRKPSLLVVDDAEHLDEVSWGVIQSEARSGAVPILSARAGDRADGARGSGLAVELPLAPLGFEDIEYVLASRLRAPVQLDTVSRIFSASGGLVGLACAIADTTLWRGGFEQDATGTWFASGDLWSPLLAPAVDAYLGGLDPEERTALEEIALLGFTDVQTMRRIVPWRVLERLEHRGLLHIARDEGRQLVSAFPPLIVEAARKEPRPVRRASLAEQISAALGGTGEEVAALSAMAADTSATDARALQVRLFHERARSRIIAARLEWSANPGAAQAVAFVEALLHSAADRDEIDAVIAATDPDSGAPPQRARFVQLQAEWLALGKDDLPAALELLAAPPARLDGHERLLEATAVRLQTLLDRVPEDFAPRLEVDGTCPAEVADALLETQALVLLGLGRLSDARRALESVGRGRMADRQSRANILFGMLLFAEGSFAEALQWAAEGVAAAKRELTPDALFDHGYLIVLGSVFEGDYAKTEDTVSALLGVGEPSPLLVHTHLALRTLATMGAVRRGSLAVADRFVRGIETLPVETGPLLGQSRLIALAQVAAFNGEKERAIDDLWAEGERNWGLGYRYAAAQQLLMSAEMCMTPERMDRLREVMRQIEGDFLHSFFDFLLAREAADPAGLVALAPRLAPPGRPGLAVAALELATELARSLGRPEVEEAAAEATAELLATLDGRPIDTKRFLAYAVSLSERETEIAHLIADGLSNPEIASLLVVSVRTIESHLNRILRKTGTANRADLIAYVRDGKVPRTG